MHLRQQQYKRRPKRLTAGARHKPRGFHFCNMHRMGPPHHFMKLFSLKGQVPFQCKILFLVLKPLSQLFSEDHQKYSFSAGGMGRLLIAPGGGARNKDTPGPPPSTNKLALGGSDPLPSTNELALGGSDPPPSPNELVRGGVVLTLPA